MAREQKLPGLIDPAKTKFVPSTTRIMIWVVVGGVGVYLATTGLIGMLGKGQ
jgi:hypothetical protein